MKIKPKYIYLFAFVAVAFIMLPATNGDYLYTIQENQVFINGHTFMVDIIEHEGGWLAWMACYLTQFFYHPWLGSAIIIVLWSIIYLLTIHLFQIKGKLTPIALFLPLLLLFNLLDYGYWIYYAKTPGFPFQPTLLAFFVLLCAQLAIPLLKRFKWCSRHGIILPICLCCIILAISAITIWKPQHRNFLTNHKSSILVTLTDKNFRHEMKMYRALDEFKFEDVIEEIHACKGAPTRLMILYKNIALMQTGRIQDIFKTDNNGIRSNSDNELKVKTSLLGAPLAYYHFGLFNFSYRWAMENSVKYGQSFRNLKMLARCAIMNHEFDVAIKYLALLKNSLFHRDWAKKREAWIASSTLLQQSNEFQTIAPLVTGEIPNMLDGDDGLCEKYIIGFLKTFSELDQVHSPFLEDFTMCIALWHKEAYAFCVHFYDYVNNHPNEPIPTLYQEGAILLGTDESSPITLDRFKFDAPVATKYNQFVRDYNQLQQAGIDHTEMGKRLKSVYGDTYWWYYYFCLDLNFY